MTIASGINHRGASWGRDERIIFAWPGSGLWRVSAAGGEPEQLTAVDPEEGDDHRFPEILSGGQAVLFTIVPRGGIEGAQIAVLSLETGEQKVLLAGGSHPHYAPTGHLVYSAAGTVRAVPFDSTRLEVTGAPIPVLERVSMKQTGAANVSFSDDGTLIYVPDDVEESQRQLVWVDREGRATPLTEDRRLFAFPRLSPDGTRVAVAIGSFGARNRNIWIYGGERGAGTRLTVEGDNGFPLWTPDGSRITFESFRGGAADSDGTPDIYWKPVDGSGPAEPLVIRPFTQTPLAWSPDGETLAFVSTGAVGGQPDVWLRPTEGDPVPLLATTFVESAAAFSPDGHWLAYVSNESGQLEVYVRPFPGPGGVTPISTDGGTEPVWSDRRELFYRRGNQMMVVAVETEPHLTVGRPEVLFEKADTPALEVSANYDVSPDGQRFLMVESVATDQDSRAPEIIVVENWFEELKVRVPTEP